MNVTEATLPVVCSCEVNAAELVAATVAPVGDDWEISPWFTVSVNGWVASGPMPLWAVMVIGNDPGSPAAPARTPVVASSATPVGRGPVSEKVGAG